MNVINPTLTMTEWKTEIVRTADRLPTEADGDVWSWCVKYKSWVPGRTQDKYGYPYWMKAPPNPEPKEPWREAWEAVSKTAIGDHFWQEDAFRDGWDAAIEAVLSRSASVCHDTLRQLKSK